MKFSHCTDFTALTVQWYKAIIKSGRYYPNIYPEKPSNTTELQPEGAAGGTVAAGGL